MPNFPISISFAPVGPIRTKLPAYATDGAAGLDLSAAIAGRLVLGVGERELVLTGWIIEIPDGFEGQVRARSGRALRNGLAVLNSPGTIDSDFRGEIGVILINLGGEAIIIEPGDRIAQLVIAPVVRCRPIHVETLNTTERGSGGYGSTGG